MKENVPKAVLEAAKGLIGRYGENIKKHGIYKGQEVYVYQFPENSFTGFPFVYLYDAEKNMAIEITGKTALDILTS